MLSDNNVSVYALNAKLQQKKNALRKDLAQKGMLKRGGFNDFDKYKYFSEAQYKELFTELFSKHGLEISYTELEYTMFPGTGKNANGRTVKLKCILTDIETGFSEETITTGEGMDKGDKAGYKAYTGALKYYLANTFLVATGDDPEKESPGPDDEKPNEEKPKKSAKDIPATASQKKTILAKAGDRLPKLLEFYKVKSVDELNVVTASAAIKILNAKENADVESQQ